MAYKKNDEVELEIDRLGSNGEGISNLDGKVVFVPFALPNEKVRVHIIKDDKNFYIAKLMEILKSSKERVTSPCPYFQKCGGCDIQHLNYLYGLKFKKDLVKNNLKKYGNIDFEIDDVVPSEKEYRYRNKFAFPVQEMNGEIKIGMYRKNSHDVVSIDDCLIQSELAKKLIIIFKKFMQKNHISAWNEESNSGDIKHIVVRENRGSFIFTVVVTDKNVNLKPLVDMLKNAFSSFGVYKNINKLKNNVIFGDLDIYEYGLKELEYEEFGIKYYVNNRSFLQVNDEVKNKIYSKILEILCDEKVIIDAYSGAGLLSSILTKTGAKVVGIEIVKEATENAEKLKEINNLYNLTNKNGDCAKLLPEIAKIENEEFSVVIDPPRKGIAIEVLNALLISMPRKIVYLSCDSATLARDLKLLTQKYEIKSISPFDMFPQTANVETLVYMELKEEYKLYKKTQNNVINHKNNAKIKQKPKRLSENSRYFDYYDDIKSGCQKKVDW